MPATRRTARPFPPAQATVMNDGTCRLSRTTWMTGEATLEIGILLNGEWQHAAGAIRNRKEEWSNTSLTLEGLQSRHLISLGAALEAMGREIERLIEIGLFRAE